MTIMIKNIFFLSFLLFHISFSTDVTLDITRSKSFNSYTPLNVHIETPDTKQKINPVDLILLVDDSGSMWGQKINLVKETISELINLMDDKDKLAIIKFSDCSTKLLDLTLMDSNGKQKAKNTLNNLIASGGTNIYSSIEEGFNLIYSIDYTTNDIFPTMILLSDGYDNYSDAISKFKNLLSRNKTQILKIPFNFHTFGYGPKYDSNLMNGLCKLRDGAFFHIFHLANVKNAWLEIFGAEVTNIEKYARLKVESFNFSIVNLFGKNDMMINNSSKNQYEIEIIQLRAGKSYDFVFEIDIPQNTKIGEKILKATFLDKEATYFYDEKLDNNAYEQYIRSIIFKNLSDSYYKNNVNQAKNLLKEVINWLQKINYEGNYEWEIEIQDCIAMFDRFQNEGKGDILSRIREGVSQKPGIHYNEENSYQNILIEKAYGIDISQKNSATIKPNNTYNIACPNASSYLYLYSYNNKGIILENNNYISEMNNEHESFIYLKNNSICNLNIKSNSNENFILYYWFENKNSQFLNILEFGTKSLIYIERDFPIEFYSLIDGTKDINFNIQFLDLQKNNIEYEKNTSDYFNIEAYIIDENKIQNIKNNLKPDSSVFNGFYDSGFRIGKVLISKADVRKNMNTLFKNYVYIKISLSENNENKYSKIKAIVSLTNLNNIYKSTPSNTYVVSNLLPNQKKPNLYLFKSKLNSEKYRLEFSNSNNLDFALLNFTKFQLGDERFYKNDSNLNLSFVKGMGKNYIDIQIEDSSINSIILSIFSTNGEHIAGTEIAKNSYNFNYSITTDNDYNNINTYDFTLGENVSYSSEILSEDKKKITIEFPKTIFNFTKEIIKNSKYFFKFYPIVKRN